MPSVFVNGISAKSAGGRSILTNFLTVAREESDEFEYVVAVGSADDWQEFASPRIGFIEVGAWSATTLIPLASLLVLPRLARQAGCDMVFNPADVPMRTDVPQVFLFDWPYAAYPDSPAWQLCSRKEWVARKVKLRLFRALLGKVDLMLAQTEVFAERLKELYHLKDVAVMPNAVSLDNFHGGRGRDFNLGGGYRLLCLSRHYPHKNIEIFLPVAERIRASSEDIKIVTTIFPEDGEGARRFLDEVANRDLGGIIVNVGTVPMTEVPDLYRQTDALLLPTLLESFSGTYVEAMFHRKPILTSDLPFAKAVCEDAAWYFDPSDPDEIFQRILQARDDDRLREQRLAKADELLAALPDWPETYGNFARVFRTCLDRTSSATP